MPAILWRIFLIYNLFLYLVPKKLRPFFLPFTLGPSKSAPSTAASPQSTPSPAAASLPPSVPQRPRKVMDPAELRRVFQMFDRNGDGRITRKELGDSLENLGIFVPGKELEDMIRRVDANGDGCVDMDEFEALYRSIMEERVDEEDMKEAFDVFDRNGDGFITIDELRAVMASLGLKQGRTVEDCRQMITRVDVDGDGRVNFKEFKQMMKGGGFSALS